MQLQFVSYGARTARADTFDCGVESLNNFVRERAGDFVRKGLCAVIYLMGSEGDDVYGIDFRESPQS